MDSVCCVCVAHIHVCIIHVYVYNYKNLKQSQIYERVKVYMMTWRGERRGVSDMNTVFMCEILK